RNGGQGVHEHIALLMLRLGCAIAVAREICQRHDAHEATTLDDGNATDLILTHQHGDAFQRIPRGNGHDVPRHGALYAECRKRLAARVGSHTNVAIREDPNQVTCLVDHWYGSTVELPHQARRLVQRVRWAACSSRLHQLPDRDLQT